ncbi:MAG: serine/threonine-protein kinase [Gemmatimonadaceae bacterium]
MTENFEEHLKTSLSHAYNIEGELGGGGMSRVFIATDKLLGRKIVIKLLSPELTESVNRARFRREIQVAAQLQHPHIVTLLSAGEDGELVYYTMPFIDGESLKHALEKHGPLPVREVIRVLYDVVDALGYAHARGVVHRDIKPANILRSGNHSLVTDFGVAKAINAAMAPSAMTSTGMAIGTPAYMAPEQLAGDPAADHRIDIYAVGLLAYELLAGQSPFWGATPQAVMAALLTMDPKPLKDIRKDVPPRMSSIIMQCLAKDPNDRPPNADALMAALDMIATSSGEIRTREHKVPGKAGKTKSQPVPVPVTPPRTPTVEKAFVAEVGESESKSRSRVLIPAVLVLLLLLAGGGYVWSQRGKSPSVASNQPVQGALFKDPAAGQPAASKVVAPPVITKIDSMAIAAAVAKRIAAATAAAQKKPGAAPINTDSLKKVALKEATDSANRAKAAAALAAAAPAPAPAAAPPSLPTVPAAAGKRKLSINLPAESKEQPSLNIFTKAFGDALRSAVDKGDGYSLVDSDPEVLVTPTYTGTGDTVKVSISVRDLRSSSTYGIRVLNSKVMPAYPQYYVETIVKAVMKQLDDVQHAPTIFGR